MRYASLLVSAFAGLVLVAAPQSGRAETPIAPAPTGWTQPENVAVADAGATAYHESGRYDRDVAAVDAEAGDWLAAQAPHVRKPALTLDIDETSLSNWDEEKANGFGFFLAGGCDTLPKGPCGFKSWEQSERAPAIAPTLALFRRAKQLGVAVFFITGRDEDVRDVTAANLVKAGYANWDGLILEPIHSSYHSAVDFKAPARAAIEARGYTIVATVGDQRSDLLGGHAMRGFLLPNPFYFIP